MGRELSILLAQDVGPRSHDWARDFEHDLRGRLAAYPRTRLVVYPELHLRRATTFSAHITLLSCQASWKQLARAADARSPRKPRSASAALTTDAETRRMSLDAGSGQSGVRPAQMACCGSLRTRQASL